MEDCVLVYAHSNKQQEHFMFTFLETSISPQFSSLKGNMFELFMHDYIVAECTFLCCACNTRDEAGILDFGKLDFFF